MSNCETTRGIQTVLLEKHGTAITGMAAIMGMLIALLVQARADGRERAASLTLVQQGKPRATIVLSDAALAAKPTSPNRHRRASPDPLSDERLAAEELQTHLFEMSGAHLPIVSLDQLPADHHPIFVGTVANASAKELPEKLPSDPGSFVIAVDSQRVVIRGRSGEGTLFGVYELLEQLGVRW